MALTDARSIINRSRATTGAAGIDILKFPSDIDNIPHKFVMNFKKRNSTISMSDFGAAVRADSNIRSAIALPVPTEINEKFSVDYKGEDMGLIGEAVRSVAAAGSQIATSSSPAQALADFGTRVSGYLTDPSRLGISGPDVLLGAVGTAAAGFRGAVGDIARLGYGGLSVGVGAIVNPYTTAIFKGVGLRKNEFSWLLAPNSEAESEALEDIIRSLRYYMLPSKNLFTMNYPDEVEYSIVGMSEKYQMPTKACVIESLTVSRTPIKEAGPAFFAKTGAPAFVEISMGLLEVTPLLQNELTERNMGPTNTNSVPSAAQQTTTPSATTPLIGGGMGQ